MRSTLTSRPSHHGHLRLCAEARANAVQPRLARLAFDAKIVGVHGPRVLASSQQALVDAAHLLVVKHEVRDVAHVAVGARLHHYALALAAGRAASRRRGTRSFDARAQDARHLTLAKRA